MINLHFLRRFSGMVPDSKRLLLIVWPFLAITILLVALAALAVDVLSAGRAYVGGEGLWSKAQRDAVYYLTLYAQDTAEDNYARFQRAIAVPLGDRQARLELEKRSPDLDIVRAGLIAGRTHDDDIEGVIRMYRTMRDVSYMEKVIELWEAGDEHVLELRGLGEEIHGLVTSGRSSERSLAPLVAQLYEINTRITPLSGEFSYTLGEANRALRRQLMMAIVIASIVLIPVGVVLSHRMLRRSQAFERALRVSEERFKLAVTGTNDGVWDWNIVTGDVYYSPRFRELLGMSEKDSLGSFELASRMHHGDQPKLQTALTAHLEDDDPFDIELRIACYAGEKKWFRVRGQAVRDRNGTAVRMAGSISDIHEKKLAEAQLFDEKERAVVTLASIGDGVIATDESGKVEFLNPTAEALTGWQNADVKGMHLVGLMKIKDESAREEATDLVDVVLRGGQSMTMSADVLLVQRDGTEVSVDVSAAPIRNGSGDIVGIVAVFHDVSQERHFAARLSYQASHDALTGLYNRSEFERLLNMALRHASKYRQKHAWLYLDLDQFKIVNDAGGRVAGDELIRQISALLKERLRERHACTAWWRRVRHTSGKLSSRTRNSGSERYSRSDTGLPLRVVRNAVRDGVQYRSGNDR